MARIWSTGFELNSTTANMEFLSLTGTASIDATTKRSGGYALRANPTAGTGYITHQFQTSAGTTGLFLRTYLYIASAPGAITTIVRITDSGAANKADIRLNADRTLELWVQDSVSGFTQNGSDSSALSLNTWYRIEIGWTSSTVTAKIDGTNFATDDGGWTALGTWDRFIIGAYTASTTCDLYFDDVALNNASGSFQTTYPGAGSILHMNPNAVGDNSGFTPSAGVEWQNVDEVPPDDATTYNSSTTDTIDDHNMESFTDAGGPAVDSITLVAVGWRAYQSDSSFTTGYLRIKASAGGTTEESAAMNPVATSTYETYKNVSGNTDKIHRLVLYDLPGASTTAWTTTDLNAAQIGYRHDQVFGGTMRVSNVWLLVEYIPSAVLSAIPHKAYKYMQSINRSNTY